MTNLPVLVAQTGPRTHLAGSRGTMSDTEAADERIRRLEAEVDELRNETAQGRKAAAAAEVRTPSTTTKRRSRLALPPPSLATTRFPSLPFSAHHSTPLHHLQSRGDLDVYSYWKSGISRAIKFIYWQRKCPTECAPAC